MSNIYTSYIRIKRKDKKDLSDDEIDCLFNNIVTVDEDFGSHWVRILKKYRKEEKCLDIQFGSGKRFKNILTVLANFNLYYAVERINYEGSLDRIFEYEHANNSEYASKTEPRICTYAFDRIQITCDNNWLEKEGAKPINSYTQELKVHGVYNSSNCKSFLDLYEDSEFYGPRLGFTEKYPYDFFVLTKSEVVKFLSPNFLAALEADNFKVMPDNSKMEFLFDFRKVLTIHKASSMEFQTADYWDNCVDETYMKANKSYS